MWQLLLTYEELQKAKRAYKAHRFNTPGRIDKRGNPILFLLTFEQWMNIWYSSGHWYERGRTKGKYVMSRNNDIGNYEEGNVSIITMDENLSEREWKISRTSELQRTTASRIHKGKVVSEETKTKLSNTASRKINTPEGITTAREYAKVKGVGASSIREWARLKKNGCYYI